MAAEDYIWYDDKTVAGPNGLIRERWLCIPSGITYLIGPAGEPAFGEEPGVGSGYFRIPVDVIQSVEQEGEAGHRSVPIGSPEQVGYKIGVELGILFSLGGTYAEFALKLRDYKTEAAFNLSYPSIIGSTSVDSYNFWILLTDDGDDSLAIADFRAAFHGFQRDSEKRTWDIEPGARAGFTMTLQHAGMALMEICRWDWVIDRILGSETAVEVYYLFDQFWYTGAGNYGMVFMPEPTYTYSGPDSRFVLEARFKFRMYKWDWFYEHSRNALADLYNKMSRGNGSLTFDALAASPMTEVKLYGQSYTTAESSTILADDNRWFVGDVVDADNVDPQAWESFYDGWFSDDDSIGFYTYPSLYEWFNVECETNFKRMVIEPTSRYNLNVAFLAELDTKTTPIAITIDDIEAIETIEEGEGAIGTITVQPPSPQEFDVKSYVETNDVVGVRQKYGWNAAYEITPVSGSSSTYDARLFDVEGDLMPWDNFNGSRGYSAQLMTRIWYKEDSPPNGATGPIFFRVSHKVLMPRFSSGGGVLFDNEPARALPTPHIRTNYTKDWWIENFVQKVQSVHTETQLIGGLSYASAKMLLQYIGALNGTMYTLLLPASLVDYAEIGSYFRLEPIDAVTGTYTGAPLIDKPGDLSLSHLQGIGIILSVTPKGNGLNSCKLLGIATS